MVNSGTPLDETTIAASSGLISGLIPDSSSVEAFNSANKLKLGPPPITDKLKEQVARTIQDEDAAASGVSPSKTSTELPNGHHINGDGDVEMGDAHGEDGPKEAVPEVKIEPELDPDLISPEEGETIPPTPAVFRIADLKREVEAVRDRRKMIRLGPQVIEGKANSWTPAVLPSVVAFTIFDSGEG